ncbi:DMT family transporter [Dongia deserti]|uniref:DMT family transporter n=1 Tax=Dongia deserti TaxID=2268030 RepID=UPI000E6588D9|nr:DMT family transporter [Dongia deserti]
MTREHTISKQAFGVVTLGVLWSVQPAIVKYSAITNMSPSAFLLGASATVAILLCAYNVATRHSLLSIVTKWRFYQASALTGFFFPLLVRIYISDTVPLYILTVAVALTPAFVALITRFYLGQALSTLAAWSLILGVCGTIISVLPDIADGDTALRMKSLAVVLIPFSYAVNQVFVCRAFPTDSTSIQVAAGESAHTLLITVCFVISMVLLGRDEIGDPLDVSAVSGAVLFWGIVTALETVAFFWFSARAHPISVSVAVYTSIGFSIFGGWLVFGEEVSASSLLGVILIVLSATGIAYQEGRKTSRTGVT